MNDSGRVRVGDGFGHLQGHPRRVVRRQRPAAQAIRERPAVHEFHREVRQPADAPALEDLHDPLVLEVGGGLSLREEPKEFVGFRECPREHHLERHGAVEGVLLRLVHDAHPAAAEFAGNLIPRDFRQRGWLELFCQAGIAREPGWCIRVLLEGCRYTVRRRLEAHGGIIAFVRHGWLLRRAPHHRVPPRTGQRSPL